MSNTEMKKQLEVEFQRESIFLSKNGADEIARKTKERRSKTRQRHKKAMKSLLVRIRRMDAYALFTDTSAELKSKILALRDEASLVLDLDSLTQAVEADIFTRPANDDEGAMYWMQFRQAYENLFRDIVKVSIPSDDRGTVHREARIMIESGLSALDVVSQKYREDWEKMRKDEYIDVLYTRNREPAMNRWRKEPYETKPYDYINSYVPAPMNENEIKETFKKFEADYPDNDVNFMSSLQTRSDDDDPPPKRICPVNFHFGQDIEAKYVWGMDCYSRKNIELALSDSWPEMSKSKRDHFVNHVLPCTLNTIDPKQAHDIRHALRSIQQNHPDPDLKRASGIVIDAVNRLELINFAVHPKGHGVVSKIRIPKGTVVGEYYGEVYPAWRWAEKQAEDEAKRAPGSLPDFWNIRLDRPREDRKGYDVLYV